MENRETDQQLVERARNGDTRAFDLLVKKYQHKIIGLIGRYVHDHSEVQDVAQEAFIKAYRALGKFRSESAFYTWMYRIAINTAKNHLVSRSRRPPGSDLDMADAEVLDRSGRLADIETPEAAMARDQLETAVFEAIDALPDDLRTAITLREMDGLSYEDIANIMECPVGTVRSRIFRAREAVDQRIRPFVTTARNQETVVD
ncbi:MAG TPA: RNA polymerase sigma factor RpoE [Halomonas sp.]|nr:RNA polymerase sigma factor RpoE [Halomonas sp.]